MKFLNIKNTKKLLCVALISTTVGFAGCSKFLDINDNPNNPDKADPSLLLPTVEASVSQLVGNSFQVYGNFFAQYWTQNPKTSQYRVIDQYRLLNTATDRAWLTIYRNALNNAEIIINHPDAGNERYKGIAFILKAYAFQAATDAFGDIPLTEALKGKDYISPKYEKQEVVYDSVFSYIDQGKALLKAEKVTAVGRQDMIYGGDMAKWEAFANTLKLRAYLRLSKVNAAKAEEGIKALYASNPAFLANDATITYTTTGGNENPLYNEMIGLSRVQNMVASGTAVKALQKNKDPRALAFYEPLDKTLPNGTIGKEDTIAYILQGTFLTNTKVASNPAAMVGASALQPTSAVAPVKLISASESLFLQAEAAVRGWGSGDAAALFKAGITASFTATKVSGIATYLADAPDAQFPTDQKAQIQAIITQKYYAMCGFQGFEAWTEWRRTGYPDFFVVSAASTLGAGRFPLRLPYPNSEITTNANFPGNVPVYEPVWWDVD